jgi:hypothetical protein
VLNHIPILGTVLGFLLLSVAVARKSGELKRVSLAVFVITAVVALPVYFTGEPAEEIVEHLPGVSESLIERHEEAAQDEKQPEYVHFAEKLILHAQTEEEVLYPATIMLGEYVKLKLHQ